MSGRYEHTQSEPARIWEIKHNLSTRAPIVETFVEIDGQTQKILPMSVTAISPNECHIAWSVPRTGKAGVV